MECLTCQALCSDIVTTHIIQLPDALQAGRIEKRMGKLVGYSDGACRVANPGLCAAAFVVFEDGVERFRHGRFLGSPHSNNYAEYQGVIMLLEWAEEMGYTELEVWCDSQLVVKQVSCEWNAKENLAVLCAKAFGLLHKTNSTLKWLRGHDGTLGNEIADAECNRILDIEQGKAADTPTTAKEN